MRNGGSEYFGVWMKRQFPSAVLLSMCALASGGLAQEESRQGVRDYVRSHAFGAGGYAQMSTAYDATVVPELIEMLDSKSEERYWVRVAGLLGVIGDERAADALIAFVQKPVVGTVVSEQHHDARSEALRALGFLINRTGSERALAYLIESLEPQVWRRRGVQGLGGGAVSYEEYDGWLTIYAIIGLANSGDPRAGAALRSLQQSPTKQAQIRKGLDNTLTTWLKVYDIVAAKGIAGMYEHYETQQRLEVEHQMEAQRLRGVQ